MKITDAQIKKLSLRIYSKLEESHMIEVHTSSEKILNKIELIIFQDAQTEDNIEKEARALLDKFRPQIEAGQIDSHAMFVKIKNQLMKDKKFIK